MAVLLVCGVLPKEGAAQERVRVLVWPFEIFAQRDLGYLKTRIPEVIENHLREEGAVIIEPAQSLESAKTPSPERVREVGIENRADYVILGSLTWVGKKFSLDARMIDPYGTEPVRTFYVEGDSIENLPSIVRDLTRDFALRLFKRERVVEVRIEGNDRIEDDAVRGIIDTAPGETYTPKSLSDDIKAIYNMGYFDDIRVEAEDRRGGKSVIFHVREKPTIRNIIILGNRVFDDEEIRENLSIATGAIVNVFAIQNNIQRIETLYKEKNYHNVEVTYDLQSQENNQADLVFTVDEGEKVRVEEISFKGNDAYTDKRLKKLMNTSERGFWSWLTSAGDLDREDLEQDIGKIGAFYHNTGYIDARVSDPIIEYKAEDIFITIKVEEGLRYEVGKVDIESVEDELIRPEAEMMRIIGIDEEAYYNQERVRNDVLALTDIYGNVGYANAKILPKREKSEDGQSVDITYSIEKGDPVYIEKILITGNIKTRDKVIRRQLKVLEQDLFRGGDLKRSIRNLYRLDYFEDVQVNTLPGSAGDQKVLKIDVTEKPTGTFSFGGGYSSVENLFAMAAISQRNLFGRGQILQLKAEVGGTTSRYTLSFTEPWLFDMPLSAGFDFYNWERDYNTYDKESQGGGVRFGYPVFDYTRIYLAYSYDIGDITNIDYDEASSLVKQMEGENVTSSIATTLRYDSRDRVFNPTEGSDHSISVEYAGLGGDIAFTKYLGELGQYVPLFWGTVGFLHGKAGYVADTEDGLLPDYERFYLGGINSMRGFDWRDISAYDENGDKIGGNKFLQFNLEYLIPLIREAGIVGVLFYDTGNVYNDDDSMDLSNLRESAGFGFRWYSPMGPIRIENGYILDPEADESSSGKWEFTMGGAF